MIGRATALRIVIGSATVKNALLLFDCQLARLEAHKELLRGEPGCWGATEQKTGLSKFQATSSRTSAGFLNGRNSPRVTASGTEKA
jgi:hypothetical protein